MNKPKFIFGSIKLNVSGEPKAEETAKPETSGKYVFYPKLILSHKLNDYFNLQDLVYLVRQNPVMLKMLLRQIWNK